MELLPFLKHSIDRQRFRLTKQIENTTSTSPLLGKLTIKSILENCNNFKNPIRDIIDDCYFWKLLQILKELTSEINYGCNFDEKGICKENRKERSSWTTEKCCCVHCANAVGYLQLLPPDKNILTHIARLYNTETGFWKKGTGCILERKYRSEVCLGHSCGTEFTKRSILIHKIGGYTVLQGVEAVVNYWMWKHHYSDYNRLPNAKAEFTALINEMIEFLLEHGEEAGLIKFIGYKESYVSCELWMPKKLI